MHIASFFSRAWVRSGLAMLVGTVVLASSFGLITSGPANALSCAPLSPRDRIADGDAAVIARFLGPAVPKLVSDPGTTAELFETRWIVEEWVTGDGPDAITVIMGSPRPLEGERAGIVAPRVAADRLEGGPCTFAFDADSVRAAAVELPALDGKGPPALLLAGGWPSSSGAWLDTSGRPVDWVERNSIWDASVCPDGDSIAEIRYRELRVRELATRSVTSRQDIPEETVVGFRCTADSGATARIEQGLDGHRVTIVTPGGRSTSVRLADNVLSWQWLGEASGLAVGDDGPGGLLVADITTGAVYRLDSGLHPGRVESVVGSPDGTRLGIIHQRKKRPERLSIVDLGDAPDGPPKRGVPPRRSVGTLVARTGHEKPAGGPFRRSLFWVDDATIADVFSSRAGNGERSGGVVRLRSATDLSVTCEWDGFRGEPSAVIDGIIFSWVAPSQHSTDRYLVATTVDGTRSRVVDAYRSIVSGGAIHGLPGFSSEAFLEADDVAHRETECATEP